MTEKPENPPAFPCEETAHWVRPEKHEHLGMTLRDYFAASALIGVISAEGVNVHDVPTDQGPMVARWAYAYADAMLKERQP